jgi:release factor glutamine methyltransferase
LSTLGKLYKELLKTPGLTAFDIRELILFETSFKTHDELLLHLDSPWQPTSVFSNRLARLIQGEPIAYIVESSTFFQHRFMVNPNVLIPRPETEELINLVLEKTKSMKQTLHIIDIGTGSGAIACILKKLRQEWAVGASDIDSKALEVAKQNANNLNVHIDFRKGSDLQPWDDEPIEAIVSNPPYILDPKTIDESVWAYEPHHALLSKQDESLFDPILRAFNTIPTLRFVAFELYEGWKPWIEMFLHHHSLDVSIEWIRDINQKVRFAWIERKRIK